MIIYINILTSNVNSLPQVETVPSNAAVSTLNFLNISTSDNEIIIFLDVRSLRSNWEGIMRADWQCV